MLPKPKSSSQFNILDYVEKLTPAKGKDRYICPSCQNDNLTINKDGAYQCWNGCECKDIREVIAPFNAFTHKRTGNHPLSQKARPKKEAAPISSVTSELGTLPQPATDIPKKQQQQDPKRGDVWVIQYPYSKTQWVKRVEWLDQSKDKGRDKITTPYHIDTQGEIHNTKGSIEWPLYRESEAVEYGLGKWVVLPEGEKCVECLRWLGLVAVTPQGGSWKSEILVDAVLRLKDKGVAGIVILPDRDTSGEKKADLVALCCSEAGMPYLRIKPLALWQDMPPGGDIADWVKWGKEQTMNRDDFIQRLEEELHDAATARIEEQKLNDPDERLRLELQALLKETDPVKRIRRRAEIAIHYGIKSHDIDQVILHLDKGSKLPKPRYFPLDELFDLPQSGNDYLIPGMLPVGETVLLVADPKAGKSLLAYDAAFAVATAEDTFLGETVKQGRVLIIQCDESLGSARGRLFKRGFRREDAANVQFMDTFDISQISELEERLESFRPTLVIIDSLRRITVGSEISENSAEFANAVYRIKELLFRYNTAGILIHHSSKDREAVGVGRVRGSSAIAGAVWGVWQLDSIPKPDPNNGKRLIIDPKDPTRILSVTARDIEGQRLRIELDPENNHWVNQGEDGTDEGHVSDARTNEAKIVELLKPIAPTGLESSEINEHLKLGRSLYCYLNRLLGKGIIGSRPSSTDRRRTVYFYPQGGKEKSPTPPPPPPSVPIAIEYAESHTEQALEERSQIRSQIDHRSIAKKANMDLLAASNPVQVSNAGERSQDNPKEGGGRGVAPTKPQIRVAVGELVDYSGTVAKIVGWEAGARKVQLELGGRVLPNFVAVGALKPLVKG